MFFNSDHQMPRKQRFYQRKGERRRIPTKLQVSINIHRIQLLKFTLSILSGHINQDPLERFFGCVRQKGHGSDNPNVDEFCNTTQTIRVANSVCASLHVKHGNCRGQKCNRNALEEEIKAAQPLPKRKRHKQ